MSEPTDLPSDDAPSSPAADAAQRMAEMAAREYDMSQGERFVRRPMPTLDVVNERFVRHLRPSLFQWLRRAPDTLAIEPVEVKRYAQFMEPFASASPVSYQIATLQPLRGSAVLVCEAPMVSALVDTLYGGGARLAARIEGREFSGTEQRVIQRLFTLACAAYNQAWTDIYALALTPQRIESHAQFVNIAGADEMVIATRVNLEIGNCSGSIQLGLPYGALEPIREVLYGPQQARSLAEDRRWLALLTREIQTAEITLVAELARPELSVGQLLSMKPGDFIPLDRPARVTASVDGTPVFACANGTHNGRYALRIEECLHHEDTHWLGAPHVR